jgi:hypothetical protein
MKRSCLIEKKKVRHGRFLELLCPVLFYRFLFKQKSDQINL